MKTLFRDYEVHENFVLAVFTTTFALSCMMFELIIFEIIGFLDLKYVLMLVLCCICWSGLCRHSSGLLGRAVDIPFGRSGVNFAAVDRKGNQMNCYLSGIQSVPFLS